MRRILILIMALTSLVAPVTIHSETNKATQYKSKNGDRVVISPIPKRTSAPSFKSYESKIDFYSPDNQKLCTIDYSSEDHEHGFGVVKAEWTRDNNYFVFSLTSSGGHQAWHAATLFYSVSDNTIRSLDDYVKAVGISKGDFILRTPNSVLTEVLSKPASVEREESAPTKFRLDSLVNSSHKSKHALSCAGGEVIHPNA